MAHPSKGAGRTQPVLPLRERPSREPPRFPCLMHDRDRKMNNHHHHEHQGLAAGIPSVSMKKGFLGKGNSRSTSPRVNE